MATDVEQQATFHAVSQVGFLREPPTEDQLRDIVVRAVNFVEGNPDPEKVMRLTKQRVSVYSPLQITLEDNHDHQEWLKEARSEIDWRFWNRYRIWLEQRLQSPLPPSVVRRIDDVTDEILGRLENPNRPGRWDRRGLVAGQVQSGKTSNYAGVDLQGRRRRIPVDCGSRWCAQQPESPDPSSAG